MKNLAVKKIMVIAALTSVVLLPEVSFAAKPCPKFDDLMASLDRTIKPVPYAKVREFFGGKHGHKFDALSVFTRGEFSSENTDFLTEARIYNINYATRTPAENRAMADHLMSNYIVEGSADQVNLPSATRAPKVIEHKALAAGTPPPADFFGTAEREIRTLLVRDTFPRFIRDIQEKGMVDSTGKADLSYKGCTN